MLRREAAAQRARLRHRRLRLPKPKDSVMAPGVMAPIMCGLAGGSGGVGQQAHHVNERVEDRAAT